MKDVVKKNGLQLLYTPEDIERLQDEGQSRRQNAGNLDPHSLPQGLRAIGAYSHLQGAGLLQISRDGPFMTVRYEAPTGDLSAEEFTPASFVRLSCAAVPKENRSTQSQIRWVKKWFKKSSKTRSIIEETMGCMLTKPALKPVVLSFCLALFLLSSDSAVEAEQGTSTYETKSAGVETASSRKLVIGRVSNDPSKHYKDLKAILDYGLRRLKDLGITQGSVVFAKNEEEMVQYLREGKVDWVRESVFSALIYSERTGAEIMLRRWRMGVPTYYTVLITRKDSGIHYLRDLKGMKVAFEDTGSTSAYFIPLALFRRAGLKSIRLSSPREEPPAGTVGYAFAGGELNISTWVYKGLTQAGAYSNEDWENPERNPASMKNDLRIFHQSNPFPRGVEVVRGSLDPKVKKRLQEVLLQSHQDPEGMKIFKGYTFDEFKGEAKEGLEEARRLLHYIRSDMK